MVDKIDFIEKSKSNARQALLNIAAGYEKDRATIQHAIEAYKEVIVADPNSKEADEARENLLRIAQRFEKEGKKESAFHIYQKLAKELPKRAPRQPIKY